MPPRRSGAMIAIVVVLDLALAAAGATMLFKGLAKPKAADAKPAKTELHAQAVAAPAPVATAPAPAPAAAAASSEPAGSAAPAPPTPAPAARDKTVARDPKKKGAPAKPEKPSTPDKKASANGPLDPYGTPAVDRTDEIESHARESFGAFRSCFEDAIHSGPIHGDVRIAFVVEPDGQIDHASPVVNTTGSDALAGCLAQTIGHWTFAPHSGAAASYERPFHYP